MPELTATQKEVLRDLVDSTRKGEISEEFRVLWAYEGPMVTLADKKGFMKNPKVTRLTLDSLAQEGLIQCEVNVETRVDEPFAGSQLKTVRETFRRCTITAKGYRAVDTDFIHHVPHWTDSSVPEIFSSLERFKKDHPNPDRVAFIMMRFSDTPAHQKIVSTINETLNSMGVAACRADEKEYHEDLFANILTYMHGCGFGIAVLERIERDDFNPNVSLEVGYMLGLKKKVCLLKDKNLNALHSDLVGKLYKQFDHQKPESSIPDQLLRWMEDRDLIPTQKG